MKPDVGDICHHHSWHRGAVRSVLNLHKIPTCRAAIRVTTERGCSRVTPCHLCRVWQRCTEGEQSLSMSLIPLSVRPLWSARAWLSSGSAIAARALVITRSSSCFTSWLGPSCTLALLRRAFSSRDARCMRCLQSRQSSCTLFCKRFMSLHHWLWCTRSSAGRGQRHVLSAERVQAPCRSVVATPSAACREALP